MPLVVVGDSFDIAEAHRQHGWVRSMLDLALLVHAQHQGLIGGFSTTPPRHAAFNEEGSVDSLKVSLRCG